MLGEMGARVVAVSTSHRAIYQPKGLDIPQLSRLAREFKEDPLSHYEGAEQIPLKQLLELPVEILCPCARHNSIGSEEASRLQARLIAAGANNPVTPSAESILLNREILFLPDFVTNCGGVLGGTMEYAGFTFNQIKRTLLEDLGHNVQSLLTASQLHGKSPRELATQAALAQMARVQISAQDHSFRGKMMNGITQAYRRGWIPRRLPALVSPDFFKARVVKFL
jgi:glutamate dehydrogenase/leucine dehydrogenase